MLLEYLLASKEKIVALLGLRGMGKSSLARNTLHYAAERKMFLGGIMLIQLKDIRSCFTMLKLIMRAILSFLNLSANEKRKLTDSTCSE